MSNFKEPRVYDNLGDTDTGLERVPQTIEKDLE